LTKFSEDHSVSQVTIDYTFVASRIMVLIQAATLIFKGLCI